MKQTYPLNRKRFLSLLLALVLMVSVVLPATALAESSTDVPASAASTASSATPERIRDGVILHAFDWNLSVIEDNLQAIADAGYTAIQTSPIMGSASGTNWYFAYQPRNMFAGGNGNRYGDRDAFVSLTTAAEALGIKVIVDVVANHMGSTANSDAPWNDNTHFHNVSASVGYNDRFLLTQPNMISGLRDLNTHSKFVQDSFIAYLKDMIDAGASGFRYDAIKHIELDDDAPSPASMAAGATNERYPQGEFASDYVKNVTGAAKSYFEEKGKENFQYGEVLQGGDPDNDRMAGYAKYIDMTASRYGHDVRGVLELGDIGRLDKWADYAAEGLTADRLVPWVESHDTYNNEGESLSFSPKQIRQGWAMIAARKDASPLFFARNVNADGSQRTSVLTADNVDNNRPQWSHPEVVAVNKFHNAMAGRDENLVSLGSNAVMIERGTTADGGGAVLLNASTTDRVLGSVPVKFLKDGYYANALNPSNVFTVAGGRISGTLPGNPAKVSNTDTSSNPGLVVLMGLEDASSAVLAALPSDDDVIAGNSFTGNQLRLRMSAVRVTNASYAINNGDAVSFDHDDMITVSGNYNDPITVTLVGQAAGGKWITSAFTYTRVEPEEEVAPPVAEPTHVNAYLSINRNASFQGWASTGIWAYSFNPELFGGWPGGKMTRMKYNGVDTHWYKITMPRSAVGGIIFNNNAGQQTNQPAITASMLNDEQLYFYGSSASNLNINGSSDSGNNARANWDTAFAAGNNIGYAASGIFPPGRNGVIFNTSGGSTVDNQYVREGEKATRPTVDPTRTGYLFDGKWYTDSALTQEYNFDTPVVNTLGDDHIYALTLYAGWIQLEADKFLVEFNAQGGSKVASIPNVVSGSAIAEPAPPVRDGYTFGRWYKDSAYATAWNFSTDTVTAATTLFAKWDLASYAITYRDGAVSAVMPGSEPAAYTIETPTFNLTDPSPKEGHAFDGWFTDPQFRPSAKLASVASGSVGDLTLYARFTANTYTVALDPQRGSGGTESVSVAYGGKLPLGISRPERDGYTFQGFYANADGSGQQYYNSNGVRVFEGSWLTAPASIYAHWTTSHPGPTTPPPSTPMPSTPAPSDVVKDGDKAIVELGSGMTSKSIPVQDIGGLSLQVKAANAVLTIQAEALKQWLTQAGNPPGASMEVTFASATAGDLANAPAVGGGARAKAAGAVYDMTLKLKHGNQVTDIRHVGGGVEISLPYGHEADEDLLGVYYYNEGTKAWEYVGGSVDPVKQTVTVTLEHLSKYAVLEYAKSFADVPSNHWAARTLEVLAAKHIINGTSDTLFTPNGPTTRAAFTSLLVRALGLTKAAGALPFDDVQAGQWYANEVAIAYEAGLVTGISETKFDPNGTITREQMAVLLVRAYAYENSASAASGQAAADLKDGASISSWAVEGVNKAIAAGLLQGKGNGNFDPASNASRAETAQAILNVINKR
ncbi:InlB B-repeat-containing protein [Paenibacillus xanthanilyticus]|uniref:InlB B-repeat-containing protein n=1 Tax=Paenibacillus xanthanilyticus TaxID=1783531 RepID=A0ABV8K9E5_9BACL